VRIRRLGERDATALLRPETKQSGISKTEQTPWVDEQQHGHYVVRVRCSSKPFEMAREGAVVATTRHQTYVLNINAVFPEDDILFIYCLSRLPSQRQGNDSCRQLLTGSWAERFRRIEKAAAPECILGQSARLPLAQNRHGCGCHSAIV
jgi:hypothetical protein